MNQDLFNEYVKAWRAAKDDPVRSAYITADFRRASRQSESFWESEAGFIIGGMFLLCVVLPLWLIWKTWEFTDPRWVSNTGRSQDEA